MLLMAADVYNELGQTDKAITLVNEGVLKTEAQERPVRHVMAAVW